MIQLLTNQHFWGFFINKHLLQPNKKPKTEKTMCGYIILVNALKKLFEN